MNEAVKDVLDIIAIPLTTLVLGLVLPYRWQQRERDTRIKTELVADISELIMRTVMTIYVFKTRCGNKHEIDAEQKQELHESYMRWRVETCVIGSKLHAYFPATRNRGRALHLKWNEFSDLVTEFYEKNRDGDGEVSVEALEKLVNRHKVKMEGGSKLTEYKEIVFGIKAEIIQEILASDITGFADENKFAQLTGSM